MIKDFLSDLFEGLSIILRAFLLLCGLFFCLAGLILIVNFEKGNLVYKETQQQPPAVSAVTREDLKAFIEVVNRRDAAQDVIIMGLVSRMDGKDGVGK